MQVICIALRAVTITNNACIIASNLFLYNVSFSGVPYVFLIVYLCVRSLHSVFGIVMLRWLIFLKSRAVLFEYFVT